MAEYYTDISNYEDIADAIRAKNGEATLYRPGEMAQAILDIPQGDNYQYFTGQIYTNETTNSDLFTMYTGSNPADLFRNIALSVTKLSYTDVGTLRVLHFNDDNSCGICVDNTSTTSSDLCVYNNGKIETGKITGVSTELYIFNSDQGFVFSNVDGTAPDGTSTRVHGIWIDKTNKGNTIVGSYGHISKSGNQTNLFITSVADSNIEYLPAYNNKYYNIVYPIVANGDYDDPEYSQSTYYNLANKVWSGGTYKFYNDEIEGVRSAGSSSYKNYLNHIRKK